MYMNGLGDNCAMKDVHKSRERWPYAERSPSNGSTVTQELRRRLTGALCKPTTYWWLLLQKVWYSVWADSAFKCLPGTWLYVQLMNITINRHHTPIEAKLGLDPIVQGFFDSKEAIGRVAAREMNSRSLMRQMYTRVLKVKVHGFCRT